MGRARHPGPLGVHALGLESFNVGGRLTHGDLALKSSADFLAISEQRLIPARVRSEWAALRRRGTHSVWAASSQEGSHVGHAGVGIISLKGAAVAIPIVATSAFRRFFELDLVGWFVVSCLLVVIVLCIWLWFMGSRVLRMVLNS